MAQSTEDTDYAYVLECVDIEESVDLLRNLGYRLILIFPADSPRRALVSRAGINIRLDKSQFSHDFGSKLERIKEQAFDMFPRVETFLSPALQVSEPKLPREMKVISASRRFRSGRAGMLYRDLIPERCGGFLIGSHIKIPGSGPVPDYVHFHNVNFQLIFCLSGTAQLVYEGQGPAFSFEPGDCVLQPPGIRHRVLETENDLEVIELTCPAEHETRAAQTLVLPTRDEYRERVYEGQMFRLSRAKDADWKRVDGGIIRDLGFEKASGGKIGVRSHEIEPHEYGSEFQTDAEQFKFLYVVSGAADLASDEKTKRVTVGDSVLLPPGKTTLARPAVACQVFELTVLNLSTYSEDSTVSPTS